MGRQAILAGTGFEGRDKIIRKLCKRGMLVELEREKNNIHDENAIAVYIVVKKAFGLIHSKYKIGYLKGSTSKSLAPKVDSGMKVSAFISNLYAPDDLKHPQVSLTLDY